MEVTTIFLHRFLSIDIGNRYSSTIDIDYYRLLSIIGLSINYAWNNNNDNNNNRPRNFVEPPDPQTVHVENLQLREKSCCLFALLKTIS